jgi:hypothetical protein
MSVNPAAVPSTAPSPTHVALLNLLTAYKTHAFHNRSASSTCKSTNAGLFPSGAAKIQTNPEAYCIQEYTTLHREGENSVHNAMFSVQNERKSSFQESSAIYVINLK